MAQYLSPNGVWIDGESAGKSFLTPGGMFLSITGATLLDIAATANIALSGTVGVTGDIDAFGRYWRIPTNTTGTFNVSILSGSFPHTTVASGVPTVSGGFLDVLDTNGTAAGTKRFAFIHNWDFVLSPEPTSISGGPAIATLTLV